MLRQSWTPLKKAPSTSPGRLVDAWLEEAGRVRSCGGGLMVGGMDGEDPPSWIRGASPPSSTRSIIAAQ